jgi:hypothetical protein
MMHRTKQNWHKGPVRVRDERPGIEEAIAAARDLADDLDDVAAIAAGFMGVPVEEMRPHVKPLPRASAARTVVTLPPVFNATNRNARPAVVVERVRRRVPAKSL